MLPPVTELPDMDSHRVYFTPAAYGSDIYLCALSETRQLSSFSTLTELYTAHSVPNACHSSASVSFIVQNELYIFANIPNYLKWDIGKSVEFDVMEYSARNIQSFSCTETVQRGRGVYWVDYNAKTLVKFDLDEFSQREEEDS